MLKTSRVYCPMWMKFVKIISMEASRCACNVIQYYIVYVSTITLWLTYSTVQSPSWEANWFAASHEIPRILRNPKVHYRTHNRPPTVSILGQPNPVHIPTSHLLEIHPNIIHPSTPRSPQWSLSLRFPQQDPIHPLSSPIGATCPAHLILLDNHFITQGNYKATCFDYRLVTLRPILSIVSQDAMHTLGSLRVCVHWIHQSKTFVSKGVTPCNYLE